MGARRRRGELFPDNITALDAISYAPITHAIELFVVSPAGNLSRGGEVEFTVNLTRTGGYAGPVALVASSLPAGVVCDFVPPSLSGSTLSATGTLTASAAAALGLDAFSVEASGANVTAATDEGVVTVVEGAVVEPPPPGDATREVAFASYVTDGTTGTYRATGPIPLLQSFAVQPAEVAQAYVVDDGGTEVAAYIADTGMRWDGQGENGSVRALFVQVNATHGVANVRKTYTLKFRPAGPSVTPLAEQAYATHGSRLDVQIGANAARVKIGAPYPYHYFDENVVRRTAANLELGAWTYYSGYTLENTVARDATFLKTIECALFVTRAGALRACALKTSLLAAGNYAPPPSGFEHLNFNSRSSELILGDADCQFLGAFRIYLDPTSVNPANFVIGTTALNASGVKLSTLAEPIAKPAGAHCESIPAAILTATDHAVLVGAPLVPWELPTQASLTAKGGDVASHAAQLRLMHDQLWKRGGTEFSIAQSGHTSYSASLCAWMMWANSTGSGAGDVRHLFRAYGYWEAWARGFRADEAAGVLAGNGNIWSGGEAKCDPTMPYFHAMLTRDPEAGVKGDGNAAYAEWFQLNNNGEAESYPNGTMRMLYRLASGLVMRQFVGRRTAMPTGTYYATGANNVALAQTRTGTTGFFADPQNRTTDGTNADRFARLARLSDYMTRNQAFRTGTPPGSRRLVMPGYADGSDGGSFTDTSTYGHAAWMSAYFYGWMEVGYHLFGDHALGVAAEQATQDWLYDAKMPDNVRPLNYSTFPDRECFFYSEGGGYAVYDGAYVIVATQNESDGENPPPGGKLWINMEVANATQGRVLQAMHARASAPNKAKWITRAQWLLNGAEATAPNPYWGKNLGEASLFGWSLLKLLADN